MPGDEVVTFTDVHSLADQIRYYLSHDDERQSIAAAGHARTIREHTYVHRFADIFSRLGFDVGPLEDLLNERVSPGGVEEVQ